MVWPEPATPNFSPDDDCAFCYERLLIPSNDNQAQASYIVDDIQLRCGHHFHWSCFEDYDRASAENRSKCPLCRGSTLDENGLLIVNIVNEGGFTGGFDLGQELDEELWREQQPEEWKKGQALLDLCQAGEFEEAETMLRDEHVDPDAAYPDGTTGLHMAAANDSPQWASLLLKYGANKELKNDAGVTALDCARSENAYSVVSLLTS